MTDMNMTLQVEVNTLEEVKELRRELEKIRDLKKEINDLDKEDDDSSIFPDDDGIDIDPNPRPKPKPDYPTRPDIWMRNGEGFEVEVDENVLADTQFRI